MLASAAKWHSTLMAEISGMPVLDGSRPDSPYTPDAPFVTDRPSERTRVENTDLLRPSSQTAPHRLDRPWILIMARLDALWRQPDVSRSMAKMMVLDADLPQLGVDSGAITKPAFKRHEDCCGFLAVIRLGVLLAPRTDPRWAENFLRLSCCRARRNTPTYSTCRCRQARRRLREIVARAPL